jgi:glycosyltransferase involved in cell wall biosynthesis
MAPMTGGQLTVLHLATNRWWTGSADPTIQLASAQQSRGYRVLLALPPGDRFESKAREAGLALLDGFHLRARLAPVQIARDAARLRRAAREHAVDVLHAHHSHDHWLALLARPSVGGRRPPVARTFHTLRAVKHDAASRRLYRRTGAALAVSRQIEARCREVGFSAERVYWTPGTADLVRFAGSADGRAVREEFALGDAPVVVSVARLAPHRGHDLLLAGFRGLLDSLPAARLLLVGKGEMRERLERLVAEQGLARRVSFAGYRDRDLPAVLAAADCFALMAPGSDDSCRAALEAMAAARPVVARALGALPETVVHGETGLLVQDDRPESVASALRAVLADRAVARAMGAAGRRRAEREFDAARVVEIVARAYRAMLESRPASMACSRR